jgi:hypothetical protein
MRKMMNMRRLFFAVLLFCCFANCCFSIYLQEGQQIIYDCCGQEYLYTPATTDDSYSIAKIHSGKTNENKLRPLEYVKKHIDKLEELSHPDIINIGTILDQLTLNDCNKLKKSLEKILPAYENLGEYRKQILNLLTIVNNKIEQMDN